MALFTTPGASLGGIPGSAALARLLVVISGNTQGLTGALSQATGSLQGFQSNATALGNTLIRTVTLPVLAIGAAAIKMASDYEAAIARVAGLTTIAADEVAGLSDRLLEMSASDEIIAGPTELADALYFAGSAGLSTAKAMQVVELSAKGASIGMGEAADISRVLISALNAFESQGLTAAAAMDALTVAIKVGSAEPDELAISLGRLLPIAAKAELSFQEVVASVASLTNIGVPARVATTALRALFSQFLAPTAKARQNLDALGISYDELQAAVRAGPVVAFNLINEATGENAERIKAIIPQIRALTAFWGLSGDRAEAAAKAFRLVNNSAGALDRALAEFTDTAAFRFKNALNDLQVAAIKFGSVALPAFGAFLSVLSDVGEALAAIPAPVKAVLGILLGLTATVGPLLKLFGGLSTASGVFVGSMGLAGKGMLIMAASAGIAIGALSSFANGTGGLVQLMVGLAGAFTTVSIALGAIRLAANALPTQAINAFTYALGTLSGGQIAAIAAGITLIVAAVVLLARNAARAQEDMNRFSEALTSAATSGQSFSTMLRHLEVSDELANRLRAIAKELEVLRKPVGPNFEAFTDAISGDLVQSLVKLDGALEDNRTGLKSMIDVVQEAIVSGQDLGKALTKAGFSSEEFFDALAVSGTETPQLGRLTDDTETLALAFGHAQEAYRNFQDEQEAILILSAAEEGAIEGLALQYGVSVDFIKEKLNEFGVTAVGLDAEATEMWAQQAGIVDSTTGEIVGDLAAQMAAEQKLIESRQENLRSAIDFFGAIENLSKVTTAKLIKEFRRVTDVQVDFATNTQRLLRRGLDPAALQFLVDQGPAAVARFVNLSGKELKQWERNFFVAMAAGDAVVLNEGKHLEGKAVNMITDFTEAILANKKLPAGAAQAIMDAVQAEFAQGNLNNSALSMIRNFTNALSTNANVPASKIGPIVVALVNKLGNDPRFAEAGEKAKLAWINGIIRNQGLTEAAGRALVAALATTTRAKAKIMDSPGRAAAVQYASGVQASDSRAKVTGAGNILAQAVRNAVDISLYGVGRATGLSFAAGIASTVGNIAQSAANIVREAIEAAEDAAHNSPRYYTYYMGQRMADDLGEGFNRTMALARPIILPNSNRPQVNNRFDLDVRIDRRRHAENMSWAAKASGR